MIKDIYVVHYTKLRERKELIEKQLRELDTTGIDSIRIKFIERHDKEHLEEATFCYKNDKDGFDSKVAPLWDSKNHPHRELSLPELSCTMKHIEAITEMTRSDNSYGMVIEDDLIFGENFLQEVRAALYHAPDDWDAIFLGDGCGANFKNHKMMSSKHFGGKIYSVEHPATNCAEAYLLKRSAAQKIAKTIIPFHLVSDWELAYQFWNHDMNVYWTDPSICHQGSKDGTFSSTLDEGQR